tara:strand:- start:120 stop:383 length:264 start_codon:yes stop_codon:yes gene_type:complete
MIEVISNYLVFLLIFQPIEEIYTCNNPNTIGVENLHLLCDWTKDDFIEYEGANVLKPYDANDNKIKAFYRNKWWRERNASNSKDFNP